MAVIYRPAHQYQLGPGSGPTGGYDCTAYAAAMAIDRATIGGSLVTGRQVRLASTEPIPDKDSPGLNLPQIVNVAFKWHVDLEVRTGAPWASFMKALREGRGAVLQGDADQLPAGITGQIGFRGDHAVYVNHVTGDGDLYWMDPLRRKGAIEVKEAIARAYAEKFAKATGVKNGGIRFATTRITPNIEAQ